jgi:hypothetical protein
MRGRRARLLWCGQRRTGSKRVMRGGSWNNNARNVRAAARNAWHPEDRNSNIGFRLARELGWAERPARDQTMTQTGGLVAGETQAGAGVGVGGAEALAKPHRWPILWSVWTRAVGGR